MWTHCDLELSGAYSRNLRAIFSVGRLPSRPTPDPSDRSGKDREAGGLDGRSVTGRRSRGQPVGTARSEIGHGDAQDRDRSVLVMEMTGWRRGVLGTRQGALEAIGTPPTLETPLGTFDLVDGVPTPESVTKLYDALDFMRGVEVFLNTVPGASLGSHAQRVSQHRSDRANQIGYTEPLPTRELLPDTEHRDHLRSMFLDLKATGPFVIEPPKQSLCVVDDFWFRYVADMGIAGPDKGEGGKYLFRPRLHGEVPDGYFVYRPPTFTNWVVFRALGGVPALKETKVYPLCGR